jgi:predicted nuclease of predicted toxin-antitoxin system
MRLLADENLDNNLLRGVHRLRPELDILRVQDVGLAGRDDSEILAWAADQERVVVTHDVATMPDFAWSRVGRGERMPGLIVMAQDVRMARAIEDLLLVVVASRAGEWEGRVLFLPFA